MRHLDKKVGVIAIVVVMMCLLMFGTAASAAVPIEFSKSSQNVSLYPKQQKRLKVNVGKKYKNKKIRWYSSNKKVGTVSQKGLFKAIRAGQTRITVKILGTSYRASVKVRVKPVIKTKSIKVSNKPKVMYLGQRVNLKAQALPMDARYRTLSYSSNNKKVLPISSRGSMKAKKTGKAKITIRVKNTSVKYSFTVVVKKPIALKKLR